MKAKLYTKVTVKIEKVSGPKNIPGAKKVIYDPVSNTTTALMPILAEEQVEELLGEFNAERNTWRDGSEHVVVHAPRRTVEVDADTLTDETEVNIFRVELI